MSLLLELEMEELQDLDFTAEETKNRFKIENLDQLTWAFRKIKALQEQKAEKAAVVQKEISRLQEWLTKQTAPVDQSITFFQSLITEYANEQRKADQKFKKATTPHGAITFKKQQQAVQWGDEQKVVQTLTEPVQDILAVITKAVEDIQTTTGNLIRVKVVTELAKTDIKKSLTTAPVKDADGNNIPGTYCLVDANGEILPEVRIVDREDKLDIKVE